MKFYFLEIDECLANPCGEGNGCTNKKNTYECSCLGGFTGSNCEIPPNFCLAHNCSNGATCQSLDTNYTCNCAPGFKGPFCQTAIGKHHLSNNYVSLFHYIYFFQVMTFIEFSK